MRAFVRGWQAARCEVMGGFIDPASRSKYIEVAFCRRLWIA